MRRFVRLSPFTLLLLLLRCSAAEAAVCAIDMGSNSVRRIVGSFENGRYSQRTIDVQTLSVGDDVTRYGRITGERLAEIERSLTAFKSACDKEGAAPIVAVGTAAYRQARNGRRVVEIASRVGVSMEIATESRESELAYLVGSLGRDGFAVIDNGSRSIELTAKDRALRYRVVDFGYRVAYERFFAKASNPSAAVDAFRKELMQVASTATFMNGKTTLVGVEFAEMVRTLFDGGVVEGRTIALDALKKKLGEITSLNASAFEAFKKQKDIDRALPRLVVAATMAEAFGYSQITLTDRELGTGLIIEAAMTRPGPGSGRGRQRSSFRMTPVPWPELMNAPDCLTARCARVGL
jgi:exopolyphosphatase/pppGpp-phosphohydrolase